MVIVVLTMLEGVWAMEHPDCALHGHGHGPQQDVSWAAHATDNETPKPSGSSSGPDEQQGGGDEPPNLNWDDDLGEAPLAHSLRLLSALPQAYPPLDDWLRPAEPWLSLPLRPPQTPIA
ncbi:MAG TPA: hypothetical protein VEQ09_12780 [Aquabacterium sp.]|nr:hypothetical protein [Aquabacterium sp.]